jgi:gliding motility-associated-like protein
MSNSDDAFQIYSPLNTTTPVSGVSWGGNNTNNNIIYFSGSASGLVFSFTNNNPNNQANWTSASCSNSGTQTPGAPNNALNTTYINSLTNNCQPITPLLLTSSSNAQSCACNGTATISASGSVAPYTYSWYDNFDVPLGQTTATAINLCTGNYYCVVTTSIGCKDTISVFVGNTCSSFGTFASATMVKNCINKQFYNTTWGGIPDQINPNGVLFDTCDYGSFFQNSSTLFLTGGEVKTFKNPGANVCGAKLFYTVYMVGNQPVNPVYTILDLPLKEPCTVGPNSFPTGGPCFNATDQKWAKEDYNIDLTVYPPGNYVLQVYYAVPGSFTSTSNCNDTIYINNNGNNYTGLFQIKPVPLISASTLEICSGETAILTSNFSSDFAWSTLETTETISVNSSGTYSLTVNLNNNCPIQTDSEQITLFQLPTVFAGVDGIICSSNTLALAGTIGGGVTNAEWTGGAGTFSPINTDLNAVYSPSPTEIASGTFTLILTTNDPTGPCPSSSDEIQITIDANPTVSAGNDQTICLTSSAELDGLIGGGASSANWFGGLGSFSPNNGILDASYLPSSSEIAAGSVILSLITDDPSGPCTSVSDDILITFDPNPTATFGFPTVYCEGDIPANLPTSSQNGITGSWSPNTVNTSLLGNSIYTFTPNIGECGLGTNLTVSISPNPIATFSFSNSFCEGTTPPTLPINSDNGLAGTWSPNTINTMQVGISNYLFVLNPGQCGFGTSIGIEINPSDVVSFSFPTSYCEGTPVSNLPNSSDDGITGLWSPNSINTNLIGVSNYTFNPDPGQCALGDIIPIVINANQIPVFSFPTSYCVGSNASILPVIADNGISGTWLPSIINTSLPASTNYFFFPNPSECSNSSTVLITINPSIQAQFSIIANYCEGDNPANLPQLSDNNILGIWSPNVVNTSIVGSSNYIFTPNSNQCEVGITLPILINANPLVNAGLDQFVCIGEDIPLHGFIAGSASSASWTGGLGSFTPDFQSLNTVYSPSQTEEIQGSVILTLVTDDPQGPCLSVSDQILISINKIPNYPLVSLDTTYCKSASAVPMSAFGNGTINWYLDANLSTVIATGTSLIPNSPLTSATYYITQAENGCESQPSVIQINVVDCEIIIPTAFTPDEDKINDLWVIDNIDDVFPKNQVFIYNRWGNLIYKSEIGKYESKPWNGQYDGTDMPSGSYYFIIEFNDVHTENKTGIVSIIK